ncbi:hypothetical protein G7L40_20425 [Paenibacillus polymyxa]|uniref:Uncharacterized protein n=1 Tax=Paenibacillus polymyxa TaxID=1406 RepID=A0A378Y080_PAEPO|nr:hypothetical protein [Paenibacillus polymyxa]MBE7896144.1 hypothetical protein [Paenibacillus polymyxa]MBG9765912.1 hypothetical protein [Paenibacillus polymyxa]MCC3256674.1 hypothetical protein [Paenibacillus polymyxa]QPK54835.1 hypothetical protein G7035_20470 [Paenibacillus polymyxa]QPK59926.1 hypothetical protein G7L40_20425 [Paenibacillus polymyxa]
MKEELSKLIVVYEEKILTEQAFRNPVMVPDEWGGLPIKPHSIDSIRSLEREYTYKEIVADLKEMIK